MGAGDRLFGVVIATNNIVTSNYSTSLASRINHVDCVDLFLILFVYPSLSPVVNLYRI